MDRFTNNYKRFFDSVKSIVSKDFWEKYNPLLPKEDEKQLELFITNWYPHMKEASSGNLEYFQKNNISPNVFENLQFLDLFEKVNDTNKDIIWEYIHSLYAISVSNKYTKEKFTNCEDVKSSITNFPELVSNMVSWKRDKKENENQKNKNKENENQKNKNKENTKTETSFGEGFLENSSLAKLAKEISSEINPSEIMGDDLKNMNNPMAVFQSLMSGDKNKGIGKLMTTVCDKLKTKMESGDIKQEKLLEEATSLLGKMGGLGDMGGLGNMGGKGGPNLGNMMKMMQNLSSMGDLFNGPNKQSKRKMRRKMKKKLSKKS